MVARRDIPGPRSRNGFSAPLVPSAHLARSRARGVGGDRMHGRRVRRARPRDLGGTRPHARRAGRRLDPTRRIATGFRRRVALAHNGVAPGRSGHGHPLRRPRVLGRASHHRWRGQRDAGSRARIRGPPSNPSWAKGIRRRAHVSGGARCRALACRPVHPEGTGRGTSRRMVVCSRGAGYSPAPCRCPATR